MQHPDYPHLFSPLRIGDFEVTNRVCHVLTGTPYEPLPVANRIIDMIVENIG